MTTMGMMWTRRLLYAGVAMSMVVQVTRGVAWVIVMLTGNIARRGVAMTMRVEVAGRVAGMIVVLTAPLLRHCRSPCWYTGFVVEASRLDAVPSRKHFCLCVARASTG